LQDTFPAAILFALPLADHDFLSFFRRRHWRTGYRYWLL